MAAIEITNVDIKGPKGDNGQSGNPTIFASAVPVKYIQPAATFTGVTVSDNGAGKVRLTGAGSHGLLSADITNANIQISSGTGWTNGLKKILSIDADNGVAIDLDVPFASQGVPVINTGLVWMAYKLVVGMSALGTAGMIKADISLSVKNTANQKGFGFRLGTTNIDQVGNLANIATYRHLFQLQNRGATNSQVNTSNVTGSGAAGGVGGFTASANLSAIDLSAAFDFSFLFKPYPGEPITLERYFIEVFP